MQSKSRNQLYTLLAVGKKQLGWDEATYREHLKLHGAVAHNNRYSASSMPIAGMINAIKAMQTAGFTPKRQQTITRLQWRAPRIRKITALWCTLADAGEVRERGYASMERWCRTVIKTNKLEWADGKGLNDCIEALKSWCQRKGVALKNG